MRRCEIVDCWLDFLAVAAQVLVVRHRSRMKTQESPRPSKTFENILLLICGSLSTLLPVASMGEWFVSNLCASEMD